MAQLKWIRYYRDDVESDMSAIHRVDDPWSMPGPRFFKLAWRLPAYQGVMRERTLAEQQQSSSQPAQPGQPAGYTGPQSPGRREVPAMQAALAMDPDFQGIFSFGGSAARR